MSRRDYRANAMERPSKFEHFRYLGDKRTQLVYDLDEWEDPAPIDDIVANDVGLVFGPDTLAEANNRGYRLARPGSHRRLPAPVLLDAMNGSFESAGYRLARHLVVPSGRDEPRPGVILCHGFPIGPFDARRSAGTFPQLIDRIAHDLGYAAMTFNFRGTGTSEGDFSLQGWVDDLRTALDYLTDETDPTEIVLIGTNTGGSIAICVAADDPRVAAAALLSPRADFDDWAEHPRRFLEHAREIGADQVARVPALGRRVEQGVPPLPADRVRPPVRSPAAARAARRGRRERARERRQAARRRPRLGRGQRAHRRGTSAPPRPAGGGDPPRLARSRARGATRPRWPADCRSDAAQDWSDEAVRSPVRRGSPCAGIVTAVPVAGAVEAASGLTVTPVVRGLIIRGTWPSPRTGRCS